MLAEHRSFSLSALVLLGLAPLALAHGHGGSGASTGMVMSVGHTSGEHGLSMNITASMSPEDAKIFGMESYFAHNEHAGLMYAHITLMILAWVVCLPLGKLSATASLGIRDLPAQ